MPQASRYTGRNRILAALPPEDFDRFSPALQPVPLSLRQVIHDVSSPIEHVYFVEQGVGSILTIMADSSAIEVGMVGSEGMVGVSAVLGSATAGQRVIVQIPGTALRMDAARCKAAFDESMAVRMAVLRFASALMNLSAQTAACNRLHSIEQRFARWVLMAHDRIQSDIMPMTHEFLASMLGVRRAGVTVTAGELQRSGLIRYHHGRITIRDRTGLQATACECYRIDHERLMEASQNQHLVPERRSSRSPIHAA
jgi:CRP-like cAMP-binding protein